MGIASVAGDVMKAIPGVGTIASGAALLGDLIPLIHDVANRPEVDQEALGKVTAARDGLVQKLTQQGMDPAQARQLVDQQLDGVLKDANTPKGGSSPAAIMGDLAGLGITAGLSKQAGLLPFFGKKGGAAGNKLLGGAGLTDADLFEKDAGAAAGGVTGAASELTDADLFEKDATGAGQTRNVFMEHPELGSLSPVRRAPVDVPQMTFTGQPPTDEGLEDYINAAQADTPDVSRSNALLMGPAGRAAYGRAAKPSDRK